MTTEHLLNPIELERAVCAICGPCASVPAQELNWGGAILRYVICCGCGLKYTRDRPTESFYAQYYQQEYWQFKTNGSIDSIVQRRVRDDKWRAQQAWNVLRQATHLTPKSTVLEVGAAWGGTLELLVKETGCTVEAVEPSDLARAHLEQEHGIPLIARMVEELSTPGTLAGRYDLIIFSHVLDIPVDPIDTLRIVRRLLAPNGKLYVDSVNFYYADPTNIYRYCIFSPETLKIALGLAGFEPIFREETAHPQQVRRVIAHEARYLRWVASPCDVRREWARPEVADLLAAQQRGLKLVERYKPPRLWRVRRVPPWLRLREGMIAKWRRRLSSPRLLKRKLRSILPGADAKG